MATFTMMDRQGKALGVVDYTPIQVVIGGVQHNLALHRVVANWQVSDPVSGGKVCDVHGLYKGIRVSSRDYTARQAKSLAIAKVKYVAERVGSERFNQVLAAGKGI